MQSGLDGLQSLLVVRETVRQTDVCEQQCLLVFGDVVHDRQRLHDLRRTFRDLGREMGKKIIKSQLRSNEINKDVKGSGMTSDDNKGSPYQVVRCGCSVECCC